MKSSNTAKEDSSKHGASKKDKHRGPKTSKGGIFPKKNIYAIITLIMGLAGIALLAAMILVDAFPIDMSMVIILLMFVMLVFASVMMARQKRWKRILGLAVALIFMLVFGSITYYLGATHAMISKISDNNNFSNAEASMSDFNPTEESFNIYITGIDQWEDEKGLDLERSDVNMIVTVNPVTKRVLMTSMPRDSYVKLHTSQQMDKLTHSGIYGVDETIKTAEDWFGIDINYYVKMNFTAVVDIIDAIGGIKVYSPVKFSSSLKPDYKYKKGWNNLGGYKALYFARERHAFDEEDAARIENQQRVMKAIIKKLTSSTTIMTRYGDIMSAAGKNLTTNMSYDEIRSLVKMQMTDLASWKIESQKITGEYGMDYVASLSSRRQYSIYRPDEKSVKKCIEKIDEVQNPTVAELEEAQEKRRKGFISSVINNALQKEEE